MYRMFHDRICKDQVVTDDNRLIRMDDYEMKPEVQQAVMDLWNQASQDNIKEIGDVDGYWQDFYEIFGFHIDGVDYEEDVNIQGGIPSIRE